MLGKMYEEQRNKHRYTVKVDDKDKPIYKKLFDELAEKEVIMNHIYINSTHTKQNNCTGSNSFRILLKSVERKLTHFHFI